MTATRLVSKPYTMLPYMHKNEKGSHRERKHGEFNGATAHADLRCTRQGQVPGSHTICISIVLGRFKRHPQNL